MRRDSFVLRRRITHFALLARDKARKLRVAMKQGFQVRWCIRYETGGGQPDIITILGLLALSYGRKLRMEVERMEDVGGRRVRRQVGSLLWREAGERGHRELSTSRFVCDTGA